MPEYIKSSDQSPPQNQKVWAHWGDPSDHDVVWFDGSSWLSYKKTNPKEYGLEPSDGRVEAPEYWAYMGEPPVSKKIDAVKVNEAPDPNRYVIQDVHEPIPYIERGAEDPDMGPRE